MAKVRFVAETMPTGVWGTLMLSIVDGDEAVAEFLKTRIKKQKEEEAKAAQEGRPPNKYLLQCELSVAYKQRTLKQQALQWELCNRIAKADHVDPETVHEAMKSIVYPKEEHYGAWISKDGSELSTTEYAEAIEWLIHECIDRPDPVDIHDIWILFTEWRYGQEFDPLEGKYADLEDYKAHHPCCEVCGDFLLRRDNEGIYRHTGHLSHIVSRGAGGEDKTSNVFVLCPKHHLAVQHGKGWEALLQIAPHLRPKYARAQARASAQKAPAEPAAPVDDFEDDIPWAEEDQKPERVVGPALPPEGQSTESEAAMVKRIFRGVVVAGQLPEEEPKAPDSNKRKMLDKLQSMADQAAERSKFYPQAETLFTEPPEKALPVDMKKAQYKDDEEDN